MSRVGRIQANAGKSAPGIKAREGALHLLASVLDRGAMLDEMGLRGSPGEKAEAHGLADLTLRRLGQIDAMLGRFVDRMPKPPVNNILRLMAAELVFAATAPHAAVDLSVRLAKGARGSAKLAGLVNAVGRRLAEHGTEIRAEQEAEGNEGSQNLPRWLWQRLKNDWGEQGAAAIATAHLALAPHDLTPARRGGAEPLAADLGAEILPTGSLRLAGRPQLSALPGFAEGAWWAQDAAAALPARLIPAPAGKRVLDLCAAPGGKTMQLAAAGAQVTALDTSERRMARLAENLERTGLKAEAVVADALAWNPEAPFDAILLDAPCSATGTMRRHPDLARRQGKIDLASLTALQASLMDRAARWLAPAGVLVYCTCSILKAEGEDQAEMFLERQPEFTRMPVRPGEAVILSEFINPKGDLRTRPDQWAARGGLDGFFAARFGRKS